MKIIFVFLIILNLTACLELKDKAASPDHTCLNAVNAMIAPQVQLFLTIPNNLLNRAVLLPISEDRKYFLNLTCETPSLYDGSSFVYCGRSTIMTTSEKESELQTKILFLLEGMTEKIELSILDEGGHLAQTVAVDLKREERMLEHTSTSACDPSYSYPEITYSGRLTPEE